MTSRTTLAVIVVSYKVRDLLRACLAATYASLARAPELQAAVWVVDNASEDGSAELVASEFPQATLIARQDNVGFAGGNNLALRALGFGGGDAPRPDLVLLLNPDAEPLDDAIGQMASYLRAHPRAGGAGARLQYPDGTFQHGAFAFPGLLQLWFDLFPPRPRRLLDTRLNGRYPRSLYDAGQPFPIGFALGASLMVRCEAIEAAGLLDEGYFMYAEEVDWCWRIQRAGWPFFCVPRARVIHHGGASTRQFSQPVHAQPLAQPTAAVPPILRPRAPVAGRTDRAVRHGGGTDAGRRLPRERGEIDAAELAERTQAAAAVSELFSRRGTP